LVNRNGFSIHHSANSARFCPAAFIFDEWRRRMVNRSCAAQGAHFTTGSWREPDVKSHLLKTAGVKVRKEPMPTHRRRFRIEEAYIGGDVPMPAVGDGEVDPMHSEIMSELRAIRAQIGG
jgi:hypothetical protein